MSRREGRAPKTRAERKKTSHANKLKRGECLNCCKLAEPDRQLCKDHLEKSREYSRTPSARAAVRVSLHKRKERLKKAGLCQDCGQNPPFPKRTLCIGCLNSRKAREADRRTRIACASDPIPLFPVDAQAPLQSLRNKIASWFHRKSEVLR